MYCTLRGGQTTFRVGEGAQGWRTTLAETGVQCLSPMSGSSHLPVTPTLGDLTPSSGSLRNCTHMCTHPLGNRSVGEGFATNPGNRELLGLRWSLSTAWRSRKTPAAPQGLSRALKHTGSIFVAGPPLMLGCKVGLVRSPGGLTVLESLLLPLRSPPPRHWPLLTSAPHSSGTSAPHRLMGDLL